MVERMANIRSGIILSKVAANATSLLQAKILNQADANAIVAIYASQLSAKRLKADAKVVTALRD
jgi:hypothetical protein